MYKSLIVLAIFGTVSVPGAAQTAPAANQAQPARPQTVKKVVCQRVDVEETTGSRLGSAPKVCKTVDVAQTGVRIGEPRLDRNCGLECALGARDVSRGEQHSAQRLIGEWEGWADPLRLREPPAGAGAVTHLRRNLATGDQARIAIRRQWREQLRRFARESGLGQTHGNPWPNRSALIACDFGRKQRNKVDQTWYV